MTNRLINSPAAKPKEKRTPQGWCDHFNGKLRGAIEGGDKQVIRDDIAWVAGKDGQIHLEHVETEADRLIKRVKAGHVSQQAIDRLSFRLKRMLWNRCLLNCDYGEPPRFWLVPSKTEKQYAEADARTGMDWFND